MPNSQRQEDRRTSTADLWFDPCCPYTWITSRWLAEVEQDRQIRISWHVMSLALLNASKSISDEYRSALAPTLGLARVSIAAQHEYGDHALRSLYTAIGTRIHEQEEPISKELVEAALGDCRLSHGLLPAMETDEWDGALVESHQAGLAKVGEDVGSPILAIDGSAFFGPVLTRIPRGKEAVTIWDGAAAIASFDHFCELKRGRSGALSFA